MSGLVRSATDFLASYHGAFGEVLIVIGPSAAAALLLAAVVRLRRRGHREVSR